MQYANDLIAQAEHLLSADRARPKRVNLRRAVSSAYYALFHEVVDQAVNLMIPVSPPELAQQARRSPTHVGIAKTCEAVIRKQLRWKGRVVRSSFSPELVVFAGAFVALQEARYIADYDLGSRLDKADAAALVEQARQALALLQDLPPSDDRTAFLSLAFLTSGKEN